VPTGAGKGVVEGEGGVKQACRGRRELQRRVAEKGRERGVAVLGDFFFFLLVNLFSMLKCDEDDFIGV